MYENTIFEIKMTVKKQGNPGKDVHFVIKTRATLWSIFSSLSLKEFDQHTVV